MKLFGIKANVALVAFGLWVFYASLDLQYFYDTSIRVPTTQRFVRDVKEMRLPALFLCPADRQRLDGLRWLSFECNLTFKAENGNCPVRLQYYEGKRPGFFRGDVGTDGDRSCIEFGTHWVGVEEEHSAAWNEITLRAAFDTVGAIPGTNALQELELGYLPLSWETSERRTTAEEYYAPLIRVPIFYLDEHSQGIGVATRAYMGKQVDKGLSHSGKYWYTYGAMQIAVQNATVPKREFPANAALRDTKRRVGVAHVVVTIEDFEEHDFQEVSPLWPFLGTCGELAGVAALLGWMLKLRRRWRHRDACGAQKSDRRGSASQYEDVDSGSDDNDRLRGSRSKGFLDGEGDIRDRDADPEIPETPGDGLRLADVRAGVAAGLTRGLSGLSWSLSGFAEGASGAGGADKAHGERAEEEEEEALLGGASSPARGVQEEDDRLARDIHSSTGASSVRGSPAARKDPRENRPAEQATSREQLLGADAIADSIGFE